MTYQINREIIIIRVFAVLTMAQRHYSEDVQFQRITLKTKQHNKISALAQYIQHG